MKVTNRIVDNCVILDISEDTFDHQKTIFLKKHVEPLFAQGHAHFVINLSDVKMLDSFGLAVIISIYKRCKENQGNLTLFGLNASITRLMEVTHMDRVLDIWETEGQAVHNARHKFSLS